jgi:hypothetical protein
MKKIALLLVFLTSSLGFSQDMKAKIQSYLEQNKTTLKLNSQDISDWFIESDGNSDVTKIDNYFIKQRYQNIEIYNAVSNVWVKNGEVINVANRFLPNISQKVNTTTPSLTALQALNKAFALVDVNPSSNEIIETIGANEFKISNGALTEDPIHAELVYQVVKNNLKLAWNFTFYTPDYKHLWDIRIDAVNGSLLGKNDMVISCGFDNHGASAQTVDKSTLFNKSFFKDEMTSPLQIQGGSYRVIPYNYVSPLETARVLISNPENATAPPKGWHDANTLTGTTTSLKYTYTRGNNHECNC